MKMIDAKGQVTEADLDKLRAEFLQWHLAPILDRAINAPSLRATLRGSTSAFALGVFS